MAAFSFSSVCHLPVFWILSPTEKPAFTFLRFLHVTALSLIVLNVPAPLPSLSFFQTSTLACLSVAAFCINSSEFAGLLGYMWIKALLNLGGFWLLLFQMFLLLLFLNHLFLGLPLCVCWGASCQCLTLCSFSSSTFPAPRLDHTN